VPESWIRSPAGQWLLSNERKMVNQLLPELHGYYQLQYSGLGVKLLQQTSLDHDFYVSQAQDADDSLACIDYCHLPFRENTMDAVVLHHVLDFTQNPHQCLRDAARVVVPNGYLVVVGFNPWSICGVRRRFAREHRGPWRGYHITMSRLKDWMALLGFRDEKHGYGQFFFPLHIRGFHGVVNTLDSGLSRMGLPIGGVYVLIARKLVAGMTPIRPKWRPLPARGLSIATPTTRGVRVTHR